MFSELFLEVAGLCTFQRSYRWPQSSTEIDLSSGSGSVSLDTTLHGASARIESETMFAKTYCSFPSAEKANLIHSKRVGVAAVMIGPSGLVHAEDTYNER